MAPLLPPDNGGSPFLKLHSDSPAALSPKTNRGNSGDSTPVSRPKKTQKPLHFFHTITFHHTLPRTLVQKFFAWCEQFCKILFDWTQTAYCLYNPLTQKQVNIVESQPHSVTYKNILIFLALNAVSCFAATVVAVLGKLLFRVLHRFQGSEQNVSHLLPHGGRLSGDSLRALGSFKDSLSGRGSGMFRNNVGWDHPKKNKKGLPPDFPFKEQKGVSPPKGGKHSASIFYKHKLPPLVGPDNMQDLLHSITEGLEAIQSHDYSKYKKTDPEKKSDDNPPTKTPPLPSCSCFLPMAHKISSDMQQLSSHAKKLLAGACIGKLKTYDNDFYDVYIHSYLESHDALMKSIKHFVTLMQSGKHHLDYFLPIFREWKELEKAYINLANKISQCTPSLIEKDVRTAFSWKENDDQLAPLPIRIILACCRFFRRIIPLRDSFAGLCVVNVRMRMLLTTATSEDKPPPAQKKNKGRKKPSPDQDLLKMLKYFSITFPTAVMGFTRKHVSPLRRCFYQVGQALCKVFPTNDVVTENTAESQSLSLSGIEKELGKYASVLDLFKTCVDYRKIIARSPMLSPEGCPPPPDNSGKNLILDTLYSNVHLSRDGHIIKPKDPLSGTLGSLTKHGRDSLLALSHRFSTLSIGELPTAIPLDSNEENSIEKMPPGISFVIELCILPEYCESKTGPETGLQRLDFDKNPWLFFRAGRGFFPPNTKGKDPYYIHGKNTIYRLGKKMGNISMNNLEVDGCISNLTLFARSIGGTPLFSSIISNNELFLNSPECWSGNRHLREAASWPSFFIRKIITENAIAKYAIHAPETDCPFFEKGPLKIDRETSELLAFENIPRKCFRALYLNGNVFSPEEFDQIAKRLKALNVEIPVHFVKPSSE